MRTIPPSATEFPLRILRLSMAAFVVLLAIGAPSALAQTHEMEPQLVDELPGMALVSSEPFAGTVDGDTDKAFRKRFEADASTVILVALASESQVGASGAAAGSLEAFEGQMLDAVRSTHASEPGVVVVKGTLDGVPATVGFYVEGAVTFTVVVFEAERSDGLFDEVLRIQTLHSMGERATQVPDDVNGTPVDDEARDGGYQAGRLTGQVLIFGLIGIGFFKLVKRLGGSKSDPPAPSSPTPTEPDS